MQVAEMKIRLLGNFGFYYVLIIECQCGRSCARTLPAEAPDKLVFFYV